jgi:hypothetical protein
VREKLPGLMISPIKQGQSLSKLFCSRRIGADH